MASNGNDVREDVEQATQHGKRAAAKAALKHVPRPNLGKATPATKLQLLVVLVLVVACVAAGWDRWQGRDVTWFADACSAADGQVVDTATDQVCELPGGDYRWRSLWAPGQQMGGAA